MKTFRNLPIALVFLLIMAGCNLPESSPTAIPGLAYTQAAETVNAALTAAAPSSTQMGIATPTYTLQPTYTIPPVQPSNSPIPSAVVPTATTVPCNQAKFVKDVTIDDGTVMTPGQTFPKTWRLQNVGTCTWSSSYQLVFDHGDAMGGPASQSLTAGTVAPLQMIDVSVNLTAPSTPGTYKGYWKLRDNNGVLFGLSSGNSFWVEIKVSNPVITVTLNNVAGENGAVYSSGGTLAFPNLGDTNDNRGTQVFLSWDISSIPAGSTITEAKINLSDYDTLGNPFVALGCIRVYAVSFLPMDAGDFVLPLPASGHLTKFCQVADLNTLQTDNDFKITLQSKVGTTRYQLRMQFEINTNTDGIGDMVRFGTVKLTVSYTAP
jgi:hypothetical protein